MADLIITLTNDNADVQKRSLTLETVRILRALADQIEQGVEAYHGPLWQADGITLRHTNGDACGRVEYDLDA